MESQRKFDKRFLGAWNYRIIREFRSKSQDDVVKALEAEAEKPDGIKQNVSVWENLKGNPGQKYIDPLSKFLNVPKHVFSMESLTEEYLKKEFPNENHAPMPKTGDNKEKQEPSIEDVLNHLVQGKTNYILMNKELILEKYRLVSIDKLNQEKLESDRKHQELLEELQIKKDEIKSQQETMTKILHAMGEIVKKLPGPPPHLAEIDKA